MISSTLPQSQPIYPTFSEEVASKCQELIRKIKEIALSIFSLIYSCFCYCLPCLFSAISPEELQRLKALEEEENAQFQERIEKVDKLDEGINLGSGSEQIARCVGLGHLQVPQIGQYNSDEYNLAIPVTAVRLPRNQIKVFHQGIQEQFKQIPLEKLEVFFMMYNEGDLFEGNLRNINFHPNAFSDCQNGDSKEIWADMGLFEPQGVQSNTGRSFIAANHFSSAVISIHPSEERMAMSPNNAQICVDSSQSCSSFQIAANFPDGRAVAAFCLLLRENHPFGPAISQSNIRSFLQQIEQINTLSDSLKTQIKNLFEFQWMFHP